MHRAHLKRFGGEQREKTIRKAEEYSPNTQRQEMQHRIQEQEKMKSEVKKLQLNVVRNPSIDFV